MCKKIKAKIESQKIKYRQNIKYGTDRLNLINHDRQDPQEGSHLGTESGLPFSHSFLAVVHSL